MKVLRTLIFLTLFLNSCRSFSQFQLRTFVNYNFSGLTTENFGVLRKGYSILDSSQANGPSGVVSTFSGGLKIRDYNHIQAGLGFRFFPMRRFFIEPRIAGGTYQTKYIFDVYQRQDEFDPDGIFISEPQNSKIEFTSQFVRFYVSIGFDFGLKIGDNAFIKIENYYMNHGGMQLRFMDGVNHPKSMEWGMNQNWADVDVYSSSNILGGNMIAGSTGPYYIPNGSSYASVVYTRANVVSFEKSIGKRKLSSFSIGFGVTSNRPSLLSHFLSGRKDFGLKWNSPNYNSSIGYSYGGGKSKVDYLLSARLDISLFHKDRRKKKIKIDPTPQEPVIFY